MSTLYDVSIIALVVGLFYCAFKMIHELKNPHYESDDEKRSKY